MSDIHRSDLGGLKFDVRENSGMRLAQTNARSNIIYTHKNFSSNLNLN